MRERHSLSADLRAHLEKLDPEQLADIGAVLDLVTLQSVLQLQVRGTATRLGGALRGATREVLSGNLDPVAVWRQIRRGYNSKNASGLTNELTKRASELRLSQDPSQLVQHVYQGMVRRSAYRKPVSGSADPDAAVRSAWVAAGQAHKVACGEIADEQLPEVVLGAILDDVLRQAKEGLSRMSAAEERVVIERLRDNLSALPEERRQEMTRALRLDQLTAEALLQVLKRGAGVGIPLALASSGPGVFFFATTVTHAIFTTLLGITLPFGVYTAMTTALGFILGLPAFLLTGSIAYGAYRSQARRFDRQVLATVLFQVYVATM